MFTLATHTIIFIFLSSLLAGCGKTTSPYNSDQYPLEAREEQEGYFRAQLKPVNSKINSRVSGRVSVFLRGNQFYAKVRASSGYKSVTHIQGIHVGTRCPTIHDDVNRDGVVDGAETLQVVGRMLVPLDGDLSRQLRNFHLWPTTNRKGEYLYARSTAVEDIMGELRTRSPRPHELVTRLGTDQEFQLAQRVIVIYGVPYDTRLPGGIKSISGFPPYMLIPIACGHLYETGETYPFD